MSCEKSSLEIFNSNILSYIEKNSFVIFIIFQILVFFHFVENFILSNFNNLNFFLQNYVWSPWPSGHGSRFGI